MTRVRPYPIRRICHPVVNVKLALSTQSSIAVVYAAPPVGINSTSPAEENVISAWKGGFERPLLKWSMGRFHPLFIVNPGLRLLDLNRAGEKLLQIDGEILVASGQFGFVDKVRTAQLRACLGNGGSESRSGASGWSYRRTSGEFVVVHVEWLPSDAVDGAGSLVALTFPPYDGTARYVWAEFAHHFDLTRSEAAIVKRLVAGQTPAIIAEELGLSIETVRTHIRRTYNKLGISCREQLFSVIVLFRLG